MLVRDWNKGERGPQRLKDENGRRLHCCCVCNKVEQWSDTWSWYGSSKQEEDCEPLPKFCSDTCRISGGLKSKNVTYAQRVIAKAKEWREPVPAWREATEKEKYEAAVARQIRPTHP